MHVYPYLGRLGQEGHKVKISLGYIARPGLRKTRTGFKNEVVGFYRIKSRKKVQTEGQGTRLCSWDSWGHEQKAEDTGAG